MLYPLLLSIASALPPQFKVLILLYYIISFIIAGGPELQRNLNKLAENDVLLGLAPSTIKVYNRVWQDWEVYRVEHLNTSNNNISELHVRNYIAYLRHYQGKTAAAITTALSGLAFHFKLKTTFDPTKSTPISTMLKGYKSMDQRHNLRLPINYTLTYKIALKAQKMGNYEGILYSAMFASMYLAALRASECSHTLHNLLASNMVISSDHITFTLNSFKHSTVPHSISVHSHPELRLFIQHFAEIRVKNKFFFVHQSGAPLTRREISNKLDNLLIQLNIDPRSYNTHSFRIGRATDMGLAGCSEAQIRALGRWESDAYKKYIKITHINM